MGLPKVENKTQEDKVYRLSTSENRTPYHFGNKDEGS